VTISEALSLWRVEGGITVGAEGRGTISIFDGGTLRTTSVTTIGTALSSVGKVEVNGTGALWNSVNSGVILGSGGTGRLHVFNGGRVSFGQALALGSNTGSRGEVWVDGLDSTLTTATQITTGAGEANVTVSNGGVISASSIPWGSNGRLTLNGGRLEVTGSGITNQGLIRGHGTIDSVTFNNQQNGSIRGRLLVGFAEHLLLTGSLTNTGLVDVDGGELEVVGTTTNSFDIDARNGATLRFNGTFALDNMSGGQLAISAGNVDVFGTVRNNSGAQILVGNGASAVFHDSITNNGTVVVMSGSTLLALEQLNFLTNSSMLNVQLGEFDAFEDEFPVQSAGTIIIEGDLDVTLTAGFQPQAGDVFPLLFSGNTLAGVFSDESLPSLSAGLAWETIRTTNTLSLLVVESGTAGDFDGDGDVDGRDFLVWQRGNSPNPLSASDLADWQANYGSGSLVAASSAVPEPGCIVLLVPGVFMISRLSRKRPPNC
jgi:T5SS/PEP-CTERM-associated repeat protein